MNEIVPRWEFRVFGQDFREPLATLRELAPCEGVDSSLETYLVPCSVLDRNFKVRDGCFDVKALLDTDSGLERWKPTANKALPLTRRWLRDELLPGLVTANVELTKDEYDLPQLVKAIHCAPG